MLQAIKALSVAEAVRFAGERFLAMCKAHIAPSAGPKLFTFYTALKQHLTGLTIMVDPETFNPQQLEAFAKLPALQKLEVECARSVAMTAGYHTLISSGSPRLAEAAFDDTESLHIEVKNAVLTKLELLRCTGVQLTAESLEKQLQSLVTLIVRDCSEVGEQLIGYVSQLQQLRRLEYTLDGIHSSSLHAT